MKHWIPIIALMSAGQTCHAGPFSNALASIDKASQYDAAGGSLADVAPEFDTSTLLVTSELPPDSQPTPWFGVSRGLNVLNITKKDVPIDPGCGADARVLIEAAKYTEARKLIGVEIDPQIAASARAYVKRFERDYPEHRGKIEIITGDSTKMDWRELGANVAFVYMWPEVLKQMKDQLTSMDRFVSYDFQVPGLEMKQDRQIWHWDASEQAEDKEVAATVRVPVYEQFETYDNLSPGSYCEQCGTYCRSPMTHKRLEKRIVRYRVVPAKAQQPATIVQPVTTLPPPPVVRWSTQTTGWSSYCTNGRCNRRHRRM